MLGEVKFSANAAKTATFTIPAGLLVSGANEVKVHEMSDTGAFSAVGIDSFDLTYTRSAVAVADQLTLGGRLGRPHAGERSSPGPRPGCSTSWRPRPPPSSAP